MPMQPRPMADTCGPFRPSGTSRIFISRFQASNCEQVVMELTHACPNGTSEPALHRSADSGGNGGGGVMLQAGARITALAIMLSAGVAIPAAGAPKGGGGGGGGPPGHPPHAAPAARAAPAPHAAAPKAAAPAPAARAAAPRAAPQAAAPQAARQRHAPAQASTPRAAPPTARAEPHAKPAAATAAQERPQTTGRNRDAREQQKLVQPQPGGDAARQSREGGAGPGPARAERNASPQNAPPQPQAAQKFQSAGGRQAISGGVLRNQTFANRSAARDPNARNLARATFQGRFFDPGWRRRYSHPIVIGWAGPLFWPYAYNDFADYTFYPYAYDTFWPYAYA